MERMTKKTGSKRADGYTLVKEELVQEAVNRLGQMEDIYEALLERQKKTEADMEILRSRGKTKSVQFRELLVQKVSTENILNLFGLYGLESEGGW